MNYTPETTEYIKEQYQKDPTRETVDRLAKELGKSPKSVIGKLSREGVYRREVYVSKTGEPPITKIELVAEIAHMLGKEEEDFPGLDKAPKLTLKKLKATIDDWI